MIACFKFCSEPTARDWGQWDLDAAVPCPKQPEDVFSSDVLASFFIHCDKIEAPSICYTPTVWVYHHSSQQHLLKSRNEAGLKRLIRNELCIISNSLDITHRNTGESISSRCWTWCINSYSVSMVLAFKPLVFYMHEHNGCWITFVCMPVVLNQPIGEYV